jgi:DNA primase
MNNWIDLKELKSELNFAALFESYHIELHVRGEQHHGFCPLPTHQGKRNSPSFSANLKRGIWQCFGCGQKGNVLDFAVLMEGGDPRNGEDVKRAASKLRQKGVSASGQHREVEYHPPRSENGEIVINAPLDFELKGLDATHPYLLERGFTNEVVEHFELGYCSRGLLQNRLAIPLHDEKGRLVGYAGRLVSDEAISEENPKYRFPSEKRRKGRVYEFRKSLLLYNSHRIVAPVDNLLVVEGFTGVWWLSQNGLTDVVALMGASCSSEQAKLIASLVSGRGHVWLLTDGDAAGERAAKDTLAAVAPFRFCRWLKLEEGKQPTDLSETEVRDILSFFGGGR